MIRIPTRLWHRALLVVTALVTATVTPALEAQTTKTEPSTEIPMELLFSRPLIRGTVNGEGPLALMVDPLIRTSLIAQSLADRLSLKTVRSSGQVATYSVELAFGTHKFGNVAMALGDTGYVTPGSRTNAMAVISPAAWQGQLVTLDYVRWRVRIEHGDLGDIDGRKVFGLDSESQELRVPVAAAGRELECRIDPLFPGTLLVPRSRLSEFPVDGKLIEVGPLTLRNQTFTVWEGRMGGTLTVAGRELKSPVVLFAEMTGLPIAGYGILNGRELTYHLARNRARLQ